MAEEHTAPWYNSRLVTSLSGVEEYTVQVYIFNRKTKPATRTMDHQRVRRVEKTGNAKNYDMETRLGGDRLQDDTNSDCSGASDVQSASAWDDGS